MLDLAGADAECQRADASMTRRMTVAADNRSARQRETKLGADDVNDALVDIGRTEIAYAEFGSISFQRGELLSAFGI